MSDFLTALLILMPIFLASFAAGWMSYGFRKWRKLGTPWNWRILFDTKLYQAWLKAR